MQSAILKIKEQNDQTSSTTNEKFGNHLCCGGQGFKRSMEASLGLKHVHTKQITRFYFIYLFFHIFVQFALFCQTLALASVFQAFAVGFYL